MCDLWESNPCIKLFNLFVNLLPLIYVNLTTGRKWLSQKSQSKLFYTNARELRQTEFDVWHPYEIELNP